MSNRFWYTQVIPDSSNRDTGLQEGEIPTARDLVRQISSDGKLNLDPKATNSRLLYLMAGDFNNPAAHCLRCYISHQIKFACKRLTRKHGEIGGFTNRDIFPYALEDYIELRRNVSPDILAIKILSKFDPDKAQLSTYTDRIVSRCREVRRFLKDRGISPWTDWGLLNGATKNNLENSALGVGLDEAKILLTCFQDVYTRDRRKNSKSSKICKPPTSAQLEEICSLSIQMSPKLLSLTPEDLQLKLELIANGLRTYKMGERGSNKRIITAEQEQLEIDRKEVASSEDWDVLIGKIIDRDILLHEIEQVTKIKVNRRYERHQRRKDGKPAEYLEALHFYFDRGMNQAKIAIELGWEQQSQVSRLLELKDLYAAIVDDVFNGLQSRQLIPSDSNENDDEFDSIKELIRKYLDEDIIVDDRPQTVISQAICNYLQSREQGK
jgi:hypothetical protein